ncbi:alpha/beta fold hydrolase [Sphingomonas morindae]|uniref:Alpha/beta hydrolase n=1 Tax=Sphingomonas morindae TaxID=1541170 RepID=A0ABY4X3Z1_9SPHN|nr:alpha/beta hydrolase [Sphingomonas morindae]USI71580.1 alpha/beta hydrolase [Sphingomonas morindae]
MQIVLIPGFMTDAALWDDIVPYLRRLGSVTHVDLSGTSTIREMADRVSSVMPDGAVLIGFSMGGYVARAVARTAPERVRALVLIATSARADTAQQAQRKAAAVRGIDPQRFHGLSQSAIRRSVHPDRCDDVLLIGRIREMSRRVGPEAFARQVSQMRSGDRDRLAAIRCPTLIVAADSDAIRSLEESRELQQGIIGATLQIVVSSGHMIPLERPAELAAIIVPWLTK